MPRDAPANPTDVLTSTRGGQTAGRLAKLLAPRVAERMQLIAKLANSCSWRYRTMHECDHARDEHAPSSRIGREAP
jgi:hypothetical protein